MSTHDLKALVSAALDAMGATGLVCPDIPCGCGRDDLMPCDEPHHECEAAYAVSCDGTVCKSCEARPHPMRDDFETVCFYAVRNLPDAEETP